MFNWCGPLGDAMQAGDADLVQLDEEPVDVVTAIAILSNTAALQSIKVRDRS